MGTGGAVKEAGVIGARGGSPVPICTGAGAALGEQSWQAALFRIGRALTLQSASRWDEAADEFDRAIGILDTVHGPDHPRAKRAREMREALQAARGAAGV